MSLLEHTLAKSERFSKKFEDRGTMSETIKQSTSKLFAMEDLGPVCEAEVGGDKQGGAFVEGRTELKNELSALGAEGNETELINDNQVEFKRLGNELWEQVVFLSQDQFVDQSGGVEEAYLVALSTGS